METGKETQEGQGDRDRETQREGREKREGEIGRKRTLQNEKEGER